MSGTCSIYLEERPLGILRWEEEIDKVVFTAKLNEDKRGIIRVYAHSKAHPGAFLKIGVMEPCNGGMTARKAFTYSCLKALNVNLSDIDSAVATYGDQTPDVDLNAEEKGMPLNAPDGFYIEKDIEKIIREKDLRFALEASDGILIKRAGPEHYIAAVPFSYNEEIPVSSIFSLCSVEKMGDRHYMVFGINKDGYPERLKRQK